MEYFFSSARQQVQARYGAWITTLIPEKSKQRKKLRLLALIFISVKISMVVSHLGETYVKNELKQGGHDPAILL